LIPVQVYITGINTRKINPQKTLFHSKGFFFFFFLASRYFTRNVFHYYAFCFPTEVDQKLIHIYELSALFV